MAIRYVDSNTIMDLGEKIRFKSKVEPVCGVDIPFSIISADYELIFVDTDAETETVEDQGNCNINEHTLDALIEPQKTGIYCLRFIYKIADANIYIAGASISPTSVQTGAKYAIAVDVRNVQYVLGTSDGSALATSGGSMLRVKE